MYKKKKSKGWLILLVLGMAFLAAAGVWQHRQRTLIQEAQEQEIVVLENQALIDVRIIKMLGNELTGSIESGEKTWTIPVGTEVVTKLGTTTTFARLNAGDTVQMLVQNEDAGQEILKIWIMQ